MFYILYLRCVPKGRKVSVFRVSLLHSFLERGNIWNPIFYKVVRLHVQGVVETLIITLLQIYQRIYQ